MKCARDIDPDDTQREGNEHARDLRRVNGQSARAGALKYVNNKKREKQTKNVAGAR